MRGDTQKIKMLISFIIRFIIKKTVEYDTYMQNYLADEELSLKGITNKPNKRRKIQF